MKRRRFIESRQNPKRQIDVVFAQQFAPLYTFKGKLYDLSEEAMKVVIDERCENEIKKYMPKPVLVTFKFSKEHSLHML